MKFDYTEEQRLLAESVRRFVANDYTFETRRRILQSSEGWSREAWEKLAQIGLLGLPFPVEHGGFGGRAIDLMAPMEAFGEALLVEPYLATVALAGRLIARGGTQAQKRELLPAIVEGRLVMAFAHGEGDTRVVATGDGFTMEGIKRVVMHAPSADGLVVAARTQDGVGLFAVDARAPGLSMVPCVTIDGLRAADVRFAGVRLGAQAKLESALPAADLIDEAMDYATALVCAEAVGAMKYANEATLEYLKTRKQFGVPIGAFQALQHRMVDMVIEYEQARSMASLACARVDTEEDPRERARIVSAAKIKIGDAARHISQEAVQLHGGMGMSDEMKVSHAFRRLTVIARELGDVDHHLERFARASAR